MALTCIVAYAMVAAGTPEFDVWALGVWLALVGMVLGLLLLRFSPLSTAAAISLAICIASVGVLCIDVSNAAKVNPRQWGFIVLILDASLVFTLGGEVQRGLIALTIAYLAVTEFDSAIDFGLMSAVRSTTEEAGQVTARCDCPAPPCNAVLGEAIIQFLGATAVLVTDFALTRGFAKGVQQQVALVDASIKVAGQVASALARFDLDSAGGALTGAGGTLPPELGGSLRRLLANLASYRPYLPQSCLEPREEESDECSDYSQECDGRSQPAEVEARHSRAPISDADEDSDAHSVGTRRRQSVHSRRVSRPLTDEGSTGSLGGSDAGSAPGRRPRSHNPTVARRAQKRRIALLGCNCRGTLAAAALSDAAAVGEWLRSAVERFATALSRQDGVADLLSGDHWSASFGAVSPLGTQCAKATRAAVDLHASHSSASASGAAEELAELQLTAAVCAGHALCGDFGSATAQRFMVIGGASAFLPALERVAAAWAVGTLLDSAVHGDVEQSWYCRLRKRALFPKVSLRPNGLWELVEARPQASSPQEWMYELASAPKNPWATYNEAVAGWCDSGADVALAILAAAGSAPADSGDQVCAALGALREHILSGAAIPQGPLTAAALAGDPAPVRLPQGMDFPTEEA